VVAWWIAGTTPPVLSAGVASLVFIGAAAGTLRPVTGAAGEQSDFRGTFVLTDAALASFLLGDVELGGMTTQDTELGSMELVEA